MTQINIYGASEDDKYRRSLENMGSETIQMLVGKYKDNRMRTLFGATVQQVAADRYQYVTNSSLKIADRIALWGTAFGKTMAKSTRMKAYIENEVAEIVTDEFGGWDKIPVTGEWAFLNDDLTKNGNGVVTSYSLPGAEFTQTLPSTIQNVPGPKYKVTVGVNQDGTGKVDFEQIVTGDTTPSSGDPF